MAGEPANEGINMRKANRVFALAALLCGLAGAIRAQDPPVRVARLNYISGSVSMQPAGLDTWAEAVVNRPLTTGTIFGPTPARARNCISNESAMRIDSETSFGFSQPERSHDTGPAGAGRVYVHLSGWGRRNL